MKIKIRKDYLILVIIIVILLLYLFLRNPNKIQYELPRLQSLDKDSISKIEIKKTTGTIELHKKDKHWFIVPHNYPVDQTKIDNILETIGNLTLTALISESKNYAMYDLDQENKIGIIVYKDNDILREFSLGKSADTYKHTFVKLVSDSRVYQADKDFRSDFDIEIDAWRDKSVMKFDDNEITAIDIISDGEKINFVKKIKPLEIKPKETKDREKTDKPKEEEMWMMANGKPGNKEKLNSLINLCKDLVCEKYIEGKSKGNLKNPVYQVVFHGSKNYTLAVFAKSKKNGEKYPAISSENSYPFLLTSYKAEDIMKKPEDLKKPEK